MILRRFFPTSLLPALLALACVDLSARAAGPSVLDTLLLGHTDSERSHSLVAGKSDVIAGGLDQAARRLLAPGDVPWESAPMTFTMKVDPAHENYLTVKLWGGDRGENLGRLILFADGLEVGYRNQGDYDVLNQADAEAEAPGRFLYQTVPLPPRLTAGKSSLTFKILALGPIWVYGANFEQEQKTFTGPSRGIYRIYTHTGPYFQPSADEAQGHAPTPAVRTAPGEEVIGQSKAIVIARLGKLLQSPPPSDLKQANNLLLLLGHAYQVPWTPAAHNPAVLDRILACGDLIAASINDDPKSPVLNAWTGAGPLGEAIVGTWPDLGARLDADSARKQAWASALYASVDYWRTHRRSYTNQSMIVDYNIYMANRALGLLDPAKALPQDQTLHFLYQAVGLEPWLGSNLMPGAKVDNPGDLPNANVEAPFGHGYYLVTPKGLSRELGYVAGYGETILRFVHDMAVMTGDEKIRQQLAKIEHARLNFRYPGLDADGFGCMKLASEIDNRGTHFPMSGAAYNAAADRENWWMDVPALLADDPAAVGVAQQGIADGQYFSYIAGRLKDPDTLGMMLNVGDYAKVKALKPSPVRLPMTRGQPDFVFSDEEDAVLALKQGDVRLYINFYYRAESGVNRVARILEITPELVRLATVHTDVKIDESGLTYTRPDWVGSIRSAGHPPPGQDLHQAWAGEILPISRRPADAGQPEYGKWGPFLGKAAFYSLRYGPYLIGLNTTEDQSYPLPAPAGLTHARDLVSGKRLDLSAGDVKVPPHSTIVLDCGS